MSLLLDALKKAADDKQKISDAESVENADDISDQTEIEKIEEQQEEKLEELTLDLPVEDEVSERIEEVEEQGFPELEPVPEGNVDTDAVQPDASTDKLVISDEGLSLLINKPITI